MGIIFSLSGSKAVGKTTLINGLKKTLPDLKIREGFRQTDIGLHLDIEEEFYANQRWYINREIKEYIEFKDKDNTVLLLRGPEDIEFYTLYYPIINGERWDVEANLSHELGELRKCKSDHIIYLDAPIDVIMKRKNFDKTKSRNNMANWISKWQPHLEQYMKSINYTKIINTVDLTAEDVLKKVTRWMKEKIN